MKVLTGTPEKIEVFIVGLVALAKKVFPSIGRTIQGEYLVNQRGGKDVDSLTNLRWDGAKFDEAQNIHYISNIMYSNYDAEYLALLQIKINESGLVENDDFAPTVAEV